LLLKQFSPPTTPHEHFQTLFTLGLKNRSHKKGTGMFFALQQKGLDILRAATLSHPHKHYEL
jgi:hypothetical protein